MKKQLTLLRETDWDVLIILDACRADMFKQVAESYPLIQTVRSPALHTSGWIRSVGPLLKKLDVIYFTANPIINREVERFKIDLELVSIWNYLWGKFTKEKIPSVHPLSVNGVVATYRELGKLEGRRIVVHYLQPHSPYIGSKPLALSRWTSTERFPSTKFARACNALQEPECAVEYGNITWEQLRAAYYANLELVWHAARQLAAALGSPYGDLAPRRVIVTADHGELLGEDGKFGHEDDYTDYDELWHVPWLPLEGDQAVKQDTTQDKLEALGYA